MSKITIVSEKNEVIGSKERSQLTSSDVCRTTSLQITNSKGEFLLAQRSFSKIHDPGKWGPSVAGTVEEGESYDQNVIKEALEELGRVKNLLKDRYCEDTARTTVLPKSIKWF